MNNILTNYFNLLNGFLNNTKISPINSSLPVYYFIIDGENNTFYGGTSKDIIIASSALSKSFGNAGDDTISVLQFNSSASGGTGNDLIWGINDGVYLFGDEGDDIITGGSYVNGGKGNDTLFIHGLVEVIGGEGNDKISNLDDSFNGGSFLGGQGNDIYNLKSIYNETYIYDIDGKSNVLVSGDGQKAVILGPNNDEIEISGSNIDLNSGDGNNILDINHIGFLNLIAGSGNDTLTIESGAEFKIDLGDGNNKVIFLGNHISHIRGSFIKTGSGKDHILVKEEGTIVSDFSYIELGVSTGDNDDVIILNNSSYAVGVDLGAGNDVYEGTLRWSLNGSTSQLNAGEGNDRINIRQIIAAPFLRDWYSKNYRL